MPKPSYYRHCDECTPLMGRYSVGENILGFAVHLKFLVGHLQSSKSSEFAYPVETYATKCILSPCFIEITSFPVGFV